MAPPKDIARSYPKRGITADVGFRSEPFFCGEGSFNSTQNAGNAIQFDPDFTFTNGLSVTYWMWHNGESATRYNGFFGQVAFGSITANSLRFHSKQLGASYDVANAFEARVWNHVCFTLSQDGTAVKCYLNGVEQTLGSQPASALTLPSGSGIADGGIATFQNDASAGSLSMGGYMAKYALYNAVLTQDQVRQIMRAQTFAEVNAIQACQFYFELAANNTDSTGNATTVEDRGTVTYGVTKPQLPHGLDLARGAAQARCFTGRGVDFDGSADGLSSTATLSINTSGAKATLACWVNPDVSTSGNKTIISNTIDTNNNQFTIYQNGTSYAVSAVYASGFTKVNHFANTQVTVGAWTFLCAVWNFDATSLTFYVNGVSFTDTPSTAVGSTNNTFEIGCREPAGSKSQFFDGQIASIQLFDTTLTAAQVRELYHNPEQVLPTGVSASNLRRYYPLSDYNDNGSTGGRYFQDMGADGKPAEDKGSASMAFAQPVPCPQLGLTQSATRLYFPANVANFADFTLGSALGSSFTYATWVQPVNDNSQGLYCLFTSGSSDQFSAYMLSAGTIQAGNTSNVTTTETVTLGNWTHIVITGDSSSPHAKVYINGSAATLSGTIDSAGMTETGVRIGMRGASSTANRQAHCIFAESAFWDVNLSASEVTTLYNSGVMGFDTSSVQSSQLKAWHKYDNATTLKDYSGEGRNATVSGTFAAASFPENASGSTLVGDFSLKRKGVSVLNPTGTPTSSLVQSAIISNDGSLSPDPSKGGYSFSAFIRFEQASGSSPWFPMVFSGTNYLTASKRFILNFGDTSVAANAPGISISDGSTLRDYNWPSVLSNPEEWHQLAFTVDYSTSPNTTFRLYLDGALVSTQATHAHSAFDPGDIIVGSYTSANGNFPGAIACFKINQAKLSDNEIKQIYNSDLRLIKGLANE